MSYRFVAGIDYGPRQGPVRGFVIHMAEGSNTVNYLRRENNPPRGVSVHYVIDTHGDTTQMVEESRASGSLNPRELRTSNDVDGFYGITAGKAVLGDWYRDPNSAVISLEIEGFAVTGPNKNQQAALIALVEDVRSRYPQIGLLGHRDFTTTKACPGSHIDWPALGGHGPATETNVIPRSITSEVETEVQVPKGTPYLDLDGVTVLDKDGPSDDLDWRRSPHSVVPHLHAIYATVNGVRRVVLVKDVPAREVPVVDCTAAVNAQREKDRTAVIKAVQGAIP